MSAPILASRFRIPPIAAIVASILAAHGFTGKATAQPFPDSLDTIKRLRSSQSRFERIRRNRLPLSFYPSGSSRCDLHVGRFCYWHDDNDWHAPEEHPQVSRERRQLLSQLDSAAARLPGDGWITGQRIRYLIEISQLSEALAIARDCTAAIWWCRALEGHVHHTQGQFAAADSVFDIALDAMTEERECEWRDVSLLLGGKARDMYDDKTCLDRREMEDRFWWLADPLYMVPGNERRSEHYSRLVVNELMDESASPRTIPWGRDNRELLVRFGPVTGWERYSGSRATIGSRGGVVGHHRNESWHFAPIADHLMDLSQIRVGEWDLEPYKPHERYGTGYAVEFTELTHNLYVFRDGDSAAVVTACVPPASKAIDGSDRETSKGVESGMIIAANETSTVVTKHSNDCAAMVASISAQSTLVSVEAISRSDSVAARSRYWLDIPERLSGGAESDLSISDVMLVDTDDEVPSHLELAARLARPSSVVTAGDEIGLYWEVYGLDPYSNSVQFSLSVNKIGKSFLRRAAEWVGLVGSGEEVIEMRWTEPVLDVATLKRGIMLRLTEEMSGTYMIRLTAMSATGERVMANRMIEVEP
jgi:hypothetical protein